ncbi:MAG TPA: aldolase/citrate lyase family protein [Steroidobacteraceae bacterium]|nr:aldolase/citrate lyase family protein [Steroidobacteraceae bacterium]
MNDKLGASQWKNPLVVENAGAERISRALTLGRELRRKVSAGWALGTFVMEAPVPATLNAMSLAGFDFVVIDMEHSSVDFSTLEALTTAAHAAGLATLVRPWGEDVGLIGKALDIGANGVMAARVESAARARAVVEQARFAPVGNRGFSPLTKYDALSEPLRTLDESTYVVVQIEGRHAVESIGEISAVRGIDAVFVGPYDLALSLGVPPGSAQVFTAAEQLAKSVPANVALGIYIDDPAKCADWAGRRFALQCVSFDGRMLANGARAIVAQARHAMGKKAKA